MKAGHFFSNVLPPTRRRVGLATLPAPKQSWTDAELVVQIGRRDTRALDLLYNRYSKLVYALALGITHQQAMAEEVVQDVFQTVWKSAGAVQPETPLVSWLVAITRRYALDTSGEPGPSVLEQLRAPKNDQDPCLAEQLEHLPDAGAVRPALAALPPTQRQVLELAYYGGLSCEKVAKEIGEPVGKVKLRLRTGLLMLQELLEAGT